jgi:hypothetical protein
MKFILPRNLGTGIPSPFFIACEGMSDARLIDELLQHLGIENCRVGCPSRDSVGGEGKDSLPKYLANVQNVLQQRNTALEGILVIADADDSRETSFTAVKKALQFAEFPVPLKPFSIEELKPRAAVYLIPGEGRDGTLEHILLEAAFAKNNKLEGCINTFLECIGNVDCTPNKDAKMRMSSLIGATCQDNPWASAAVIWSETHNPVPIDSPSFDHLSDFLRRFSA